jgi:hypothetical protein
MTVHDAAAREERPRASSDWILPRPRRSGAARGENHVPPAKSLRYSFAFRTLKS